jgi:hypothetical protein
MTVEPLIMMMMILDSGFIRMNAKFIVSVPAGAISPLQVNRSMFISLPMCYPYLFILEPISLEK